MMYSKVIEVIERDRSFKETDEFIYTSDKYTAKMIFSKGAHCKEVVIFKNDSPGKMFLSIKELDVLKKYFYMGKFALNISRGIQ